MLDKKDIKTMQDIITNSLGGFFEKALAPYLGEKFEKNDNDHDTFFRKLEVNEVQHGEMLEKLEKIDEHMKDHEKRIKRLEAATLD